MPLALGDGATFRQVGLVGFAYAGVDHELALYWLDSYGGGLFLPFRDATNGVEAFGVGRYLLDGAKSADLGVPVELAGSPLRSGVGEGESSEVSLGHRAQLRLDFNFAYHPSCASNTTWVCPLVPAANHLAIEVRAGERQPL